MTFKKTFEDSAGGGVSDHGALTGLDDDDHSTLYALSDGSRGNFAPTVHDHDDRYPAGNPTAPQDGQVWAYDSASGGYLPKTITEATANPAYASAQFSADFATVSGNQTVPFDTAVSDTKGLFAPAQNGFVIQRSGRYLIQVSVSARLTNEAVRVFMQLQADGLTIGRLSEDDVYPASSAPGPSGFLPVSLSTGQVVTARIFTGVSLTLIASSSTQIILVEL